MAVSGEPVLALEGKNGRLMVYWDEYRNARLLHIRYWFKNKATGEFQPGMKGIAVPEANVGDVLLAIKQVLESGREDEEDGSGADSPY